VYVANLSLTQTHYCVYETKPEANLIKILSSHLRLMTLVENHKYKFSAKNHPKPNITVNLNENFG
jgi:hypothetical protein